MNIFSQLFSTMVDFFLDIILPKSDRLINLESIPMGKLAEISKIREKYGHNYILDYKKDIVKSHIIEIKNNYNKKIARKLAVVLYDNILEEISDKYLFENFERPVITFVPMTFLAKMKRGWNQCELVIKEISKIDKGNNFIFMKQNPLCKNRETKDQVGMKREERILNQKNCFSIRKSFYRRKDFEVKKNNLILIDDVLTTGATLGEAVSAIRATDTTNKQTYRTCRRKIISIAIAH